MALEIAGDAGWGRQIERRRPGRLTSPTTDPRLLVRHYSVLLRATEIALEELAGSPPEVLEVIQKYRDQFQAQANHWSRVREQEPGAGAT